MNVSNVSYFRDEWEATVEYIGNQASIAGKRNKQSRKSRDKARAKDGVVSYVQRTNRQQKAYTIHLGTAALSKKYVLIIKITLTFSTKES